MEIPKKMKKISKLSLIIMLSMILVLTSQPTHSDSISTYGFVNFEDATVDDGDYEESIATFDKTGGTFQADNSPAIDTRSWKWKAYGDGSNNINYCNLSQGVSFVSFWVRPDIGTLSGNPTVQMRNSDGDTIIQLKIVGTTWQNNDHEDNTQNLDDWNNNQWNYFSVGFNASDEIYFQVKDNNNNWHYHTETPNEIKDNYNITQIRFWSRTTGSNTYFYFDNMTFGQYLPSGTYFDESEVASICANPISGYLNVPDQQHIEHETESPFSGDIVSVLLPISSEQYAIVSNDPEDYSLYINSFFAGNADYIQEYASGYGVIWDQLNGGSGYTLTDEKIVFSVKCNTYVSLGDIDYYWYGLGVTGSGLGLTRGHNSNTLFSDGVLSGNTNKVGAMDLSICWYYDSGAISQPEPIPNIETITQYVDSYAENGSMGWLEFYQWFSDCYHKVGDRPYIIYNLTGEGINTLKTYRLNLIKTGQDDTFVYTTLISFAKDYKKAYFRLSDYEFTDPGQFYWKLYNTTDYGLTQQDLVYTSRTIYVCPVEGDTGVGGDDILPTLSQPLGSIVGLLIILFALLAPLMVSIGLQQQTGVSIRLPTFVFAISGGTGIAVTIIMGLFPTWVPFFIIALGIISLAGSYILKLRDQGVL